MMKPRLRFAAIFVVALAVLGGGALGSRSAARAGDATPTTKSPGYKTLPNLEYAKVDDKGLLLDLYLPDKPKGPLPTVLWIHGGGWIGGDKTPCYALPLVLRGYAVLSVAYRLSTVAPFPAQIEDCKAAVRWVRANAKKYGFDPGRVGAWGASAGGHLVALMGTAGDAKDLEGAGGNAEQSSRVEAVVDYFGPTDFLQFDGHGSTIVAAAPGSIIETLFGGPLATKKDLAVQANPITFVSKDDPPFLICHGDKDPLVPLMQSEMLRDALKKAGVEATLDVVHGAGHGFASSEPMKMVFDFFDEHLKKGPAAKIDPAPTTVLPK